ncbi:MAG: hypothetical protein KGJ09_05865 [Candidatus Omnitrophica bacterium]|nr:hypothetical protein [Candidatus Omnitrophota bacterium]MDE2009586.1 hypothetical protein [Candidatus Omnitrophota bacterium]MDE2214630.1 hypothetical protein [Candidatus Omnitrophota bacterium]MDE2232222.1 hypothetical protein [Candidatus Omnitrophota bacterium]
MLKKYGTYAALAAVIILGMAPPVYAQTKAFKKFYVYKDKGYLNHFEASGFMPDGRCVALDDAWTKNCGGRESCIKADFDRDCSALGTGWAGVFWLSPANNWGDEKGGYNLTGAKKLVFWARGEKGGEVVTFKMGGVGMGHQYPDSDSASSGPITLTKDWKKYSIDLAGKDLSYISGGFAWVGRVKENQSNITFYLADIYYE